MDRQFRDHFAQDWNAHEETHRACACGCASHPVRGQRSDLGDLSLSVGGTGYFYTGDFDNTYLEANFGAGVGLFSLEFSVGQYDTAPASLNYWFVAATLEQNGLYATVGTFGDGFDGEYLEAGYGFTASDLDLTIG